MEKHAYLIIAHGNFGILKKLVELLDDIRNDIYIHIDKKVKTFNFDEYKNISKLSSVFFTNKRYNVKWGHSSQVKTEMLLFKTAAKSGYNYYHLLSGVDLPLKSQNYIHKFFDKKNLIFLSNKANYTVWDYQRLSIFHWPKWFGAKLIFVLNKLQIKLKVDRIKKYKMKFERGFNWCSIPHDAVLYLIKNQRFIKRICRFSSCADEVYKQFLLFNSPLKDKIYKNQYGQTDDLREIDWNRRVKDSPHIYTIEDKNILLNSSKLFARKFDENVDKEIIDEVVNFVRSME